MVATNWALRKKGFRQVSGRQKKPEAYNKNIIYGGSHYVSICKRNASEKAKAGHYAVGQFNINNLEWTKAILATAQECNSPVILGVSEGAGKYMTGYKTVVGMVKGMMEEMNITVPVALHLDHGSIRGMPEMCRGRFLLHHVRRFSLSDRRERCKDQRAG